MEEVLGMMKLIVFIILLRDYTFLGMQPRIRRRASPVVVPGGVVGVPLPLCLDSICISCSETATPQTWGKEKCVTITIQKPPSSWDALTRVLGSLSGSLEHPGLPI